MNKYLENDLQATNLKKEDNLIKEFNEDEINNLHQSDLKKTSTDNKNYNSILKNKNEFNEYDKKIDKEEQKIEELRKNLKGNSNTKIERNPDDE